MKKKDGTTQFSIDYRRLTKVDAYPLPHIEDSLNTLGGARFFCSLDLASGYWQVEMDAADREKTVFVTQGGLYEFRVMPFGRVNDPATFVRALKHFKCYLYGQKIRVRTDNSAVSWLHRSKDPVGQPARRIEVINTDRAGSTGMQTPSPGTRADSAEETVREPQPWKCGQ